MKATSGTGPESRSEAPFSAARRFCFRDARIPRLVLEEAGADYRFETFDVFDKDDLPADYLDRHPFGKIPALEHDGFRLFETDAIASYILDITETELIPDDVKARARSPASTASSLPRLPRAVPPA